MNLSLRSPLLGLLVVGILVYGVERLIVTDAERIEEVAKQATRAIREQDWPALEEVLDEGFTYGGRDRAGTVGHVRSLVARYRPVGVKVTLYEIRVEDDEAQAKGIVEGTALGRVMRVGVDAWLRKDAEGEWRLVKVTGGEYVR